MRNVLVVLEYDGTSYHGFQVQDGSRTVQGVIESAIQAVTGETVRVAGAGRTDAGVHALGQVASFRTGSTIEAPRLPFALNAHLPEDVVVKQARDVAPGFHARFSALGRAYRYTIWNDELPSPIRRRYTAHWRGELDDRAMDQAVRAIVGAHDFASFSGAQDRSHRGRPRATLRTVCHAGCQRRGREVELEIAANAFLPHMVRNVVGTLLLVGGGRLGVAEFADVLEARDRSLAGPTAPSSGLCLMAVGYGAPIGWLGELTPGMARSLAENGRQPSEIAEAARS